MSESVNLSLMQGPGVEDALQDLYLEVLLNDVQIHRIMHVALMADGRMLAWPENLQDIGLKLDGLPDDRYLDLGELARTSGLAHRYDAANQRLYLNAPGSRLNLQLQRLDPNPARIWPATVSPGALLNYDVYATAADDSYALSALTELRVFGAFGVLSSTGLSTATDADIDTRHYVRLDSQWSWSQQQNLWTLVAGDFISGALSWTRPTRMGGLQWRRDFGLQPEVITYPLPQFFGQAALPSSVELYVNGVRQYRGELLPGPFQISAIPSISGVGQAQVVVTDALGRARVLDFSFYNSTRLLRAGLIDYSVELGAVRRDYGLDSFSYDGQPALSASLRYGAHDRLTLEMHSEGTRGLALAGIGAVLGLDGAGQLNVAYAQSHHDDAVDVDVQENEDGSSDRDGWQTTIGYGWTYRALSIDLGLTHASRNYRDIASFESRAAPLRSERASLSYGLGSAGSLALSYAGLDTIEEGRARYLGVSYSVSLQRDVSVFVGASRNLDDDDDSNVFAGLSLSPNRDLSLGASYGRSRGQDLYGVYASRPLPADGGLGWNLRAQRGDREDAYQAETSWRGDRGQATVGLRSIQSEESLYAGLDGSIVFMDGDGFLARRADSGFALVSTGGVADVPVLLENREIGRTDERGHYLLTGLNPYQPNQLSIDPLHVPVQVQVRDNHKIAVPADRAGVQVDFELREVRAALLILHDAEDQPLALGSRVLLLQSDPTAITPPVMVGYDGQVYLEGLSAHNRIAVVAPHGDECELRFTYPVGADGIPVIGPLQCGTGRR